MDTHLNPKGLSRMSKIDMYAGGLHILIEGEEEVAGRDLYTRAVTQLILEATIHSWEKDAGDGEDLVLPRFCSEVLAALAQSYKYEADLYKADDDPTRDAPQPLREVLAALVARVEEAGLLDRLILPGGDEDDV
jgi:hypothetical protein